ncbi:hypothetical protein PV11_08558 [Exophiala sideris]|uniref:DUF1680 domain protein n=1 Tax=Exophiala sideris TaxID=1016849 RepID=A0A0D1X0Y2_9EURO|nr:hypothetical protein PV11_08558 [Exophiala sideris]
MTSQVVPVQDVDISSPFWSWYQQRSREKVIPAIIHAQKSTGHWYCLTWKEGHEVKPHPFWDSDIYKVVEASCYFLMTQHDQAMMANVEEAVDMITAAQHPDGYINSYYTVRGLEKRWTNLRDMHELYCLGHLIEACVAYETLTGNGRLLAPVMKAVRHIDTVFGVEPGKKRGYPGHQEIEIGLLRLYKLTGDDLLLKLATYFIHERGQRDEAGEIYFDHEARARGGDPYDHMDLEMRVCYQYPRDYGYHQADCPIEEATEVKGHAVRAMYFYTAATDMFRLSGSQQLKDALDRLWRDMVDHKMYITGGLGAIRQWEGFGPAYFLHDTEVGGTCYAETCASFALIIWCQNLLGLELKSEYGDIMEIALYNGFLGALGLDGTSFYYENPLRTYTGHLKHRSTWFEVACCPPNTAKLLGQLGTLIYSSQPGLVAIHLFIQSTVRIPGTDVIVSIETNMPWSGEVTIRVQGTTALAIRVPSWAAKYTCSVAGDMKSGYLFVPSSTDALVHLKFELTPRKIYAHPKTDKDEVCVMMGPLVYCLEDVDNPGIDVDNVAFLDGPIRFNEPTKIGPLDQVVPILATGRELEMDESSTLYGSRAWKYKEEERQLVYVPYFLRANRGGNGGMRIWTKKLPQC